MDALSCIVSGSLCLCFGFCFWPKRRSRSLCLSPMTRNPHPATRATHPVTFHPYCRRPRTHHVASPHPDIVSSGPSPITPCPDISGSWRYCLRFNSDGWWSPGDYHLSGWTGRCHFLCSCRSCHRRRLGGAAHQHERDQGQQINGFSHTCLLVLNSFGADNSALFEMKPTRPVALACLRDGWRKSDFSRMIRDALRRPHPNRQPW
jgi:hypothetical protein